MEEIKKKKGGCFKWGLVVFGVFVLLMIIGSIGGNNESDSTDKSFLSSEDNSISINSEESMVPKKATWNFNIQKDEMTDSKNIWASIQSENYISQDFPYEGYTYATITVRYMKKYGYDVIVQITKGQIHGSDYNGTDYITARFDEGAAKKYYFNESADGSSETVFLRNKTEFIKRCKQAKKIKIDIPIYQAGRPVFTFNVDEPLVWHEE